MNPLLETKDWPAGQNIPAELWSLPGSRKASETIWDATRAPADVQAILHRSDLGLSPARLEKINGLRRGYLAKARATHTFLAVKLAEARDVGITVLRATLDPYSTSAEQLATVAHVQTVPRHERQLPAGQSEALVFCRLPEGASLAEPTRIGRLVLHPVTEEEVHLHGRPLQWNRGAMPGADATDLWRKLLDGEYQFGVSFVEPKLTADERSARGLSTREPGTFAMFERSDPHLRAGTINGEPQVELVPIVSTAAASLPKREEGAIPVNVGGQLEINPALQLKVHVPVGTTFVRDDAECSLLFVSLLRGVEDPRYPALKAALGMCLHGNLQPSVAGVGRIRSDARSRTFLALGQLSSKECRPVRTLVASGRHQSGQPWQRWASVAPGAKPVQRWARGKLLMANYCQPAWRVRGIDDDSPDLLRVLSPMQWRTLERALAGDNQHPGDKDAWTDWTAEIEALLGKGWPGAVQQQEEVPSC